MKQIVDIDEADVITTVHDNLIEVDTEPAQSSSSSVQVEQNAHHKAMTDFKPIGAVAAAGGKQFR